MSELMKHHIEEEEKEIFPAIELRISTGRNWDRKPNGSRNACWQKLAEANAGLHKREERTGRD
jgi:hemerythrin-like domain-containing protein